MIGSTHVSADTRVHLDLEGSTIEPIRIVDFFDEYNIESLIRFMRAACREHVCRQIGAVGSW